MDELLITKIVIIITIATNDKKGRHHERPKVSLIYFIFDAF